MSEKVLLVDDEEDFLEVMKERLTSRGVNVITTSSALGAIERIENELFDAVILDLQMPGMDGLDVLKRMKERRPELQVILLTGSSRRGGIVGSNRSPFFFHYILCQAIEVVIHNRKVRVIH